MDAVLPLRRGRPRRFDLSSALRVASLVADGWTAREATSLPRSWNTVLAWSREHPEVAALFALARLARAAREAWAIEAHRRDSGQAIDPAESLLISRWAEIGEAIDEFLREATREESADAIEQLRSLVGRGLAPLIEGWAYSLRHGQRGALAPSAEQLAELRAALGSKGASAVGTDSAGGGA